MKKFIFSFILLFIAISCSRIKIDSAQANPETVAREFISSVQAGDFKRAYALYNDKIIEKPPFDKFKNELSKAKFPLYSPKTTIIVIVNGDRATASSPGWGDGTGIELVQFRQKWWVSRQINSELKDRPNR